MTESILIGIVVSIIATIIISIGKPIFRKIGNYLLKIVSNYNSKFKDNIYTEAAKGNLMRIPLFNLSLTIGVLLVIFSTLTNWMYTKVDNNYTDAIDLIETVNELLGVNSNTKKDIDPSIEELKVDVNSMKEDALRLKILVIILLTSLSIWLIVQYLKYIRLYTINELYVNFNHKLIILSKTVDDKTISELKIDWAMMNSFKDYETLEAKVKSLE